MQQVLSRFVTPIKTILLTFVVVGIVSYGMYVFAGTGENTRGFAWGGSQSTDGAYQGMGWISMNNLSDGGGTSYGVNIPVSDGALSGYAWSEYYGWISFNGADLAGCNPGLGQATRSGNNITGGARILAIRDALASGNAGGYDGCISLSGSGYGLTVSGSASPLSVNGYAWSSDLGWINFSGENGFGGVTIEYVNPTGTITASTCPIPNGASSCSTTISWLVTNPYSPTSARITNGGAEIGTGVSGSTNITMFYQMPNTLVLRDRTVQSATLTDLDTEVLTATCASGLTWNPDDNLCSNLIACNDGHDNNDPEDTTSDLADFGCLNNTTDTSEADPASVDLTATPLTVPQGKKTTLRWNTHGGDETQCTLKATGNPTNLLVNNAVDGLDTGSVEVTINAQTTFTLDCPGTLDDSIVIGIVPIGFET